MEENNLKNELISAIMELTEKECAQVLKDIGVIPKYS